MSISVEAFNNISPLGPAGSQTITPPPPQDLGPSLSPKQGSPAAPAKGMPKSFGSSSKLSASAPAFRPTVSASNSRDDLADWDLPTGGYSPRGHRASAGGGATTMPHFPITAGMMAGASPLMGGGGGIPSSSLLALNATNATSAASSNRGGAGSPTGQQQWVVSSGASPGSPEAQALLQAQQQQYFHMMAQQQQWAAGGGGASTPGSTKGAPGMGGNGTLSKAAHYKAQRRQAHDKKASGRLSTLLEACKQDVSWKREGWNGVCAQGCAESNHEHPRLSSHIYIVTHLQRELGFDTFCKYFINSAGSLKPLFDAHPNLLEIRAAKGHGKFGDFSGFAVIRLWIRDDGTLPQAPQSAQAPQSPSHSPFLMVGQGSPTVGTVERFPTGTSTQKGTGIPKVSSTGSLLGIPTGGGNIPQGSSQEELMVERLLDDDEDDLIESLTNPATSNHAHGNSSANTFGVESPTTTGQAFDSVNSLGSGIIPKNYSSGGLSNIWGSNPDLTSLPATATATTVCDEARAAIPCKDIQNVLLGIAEKSCTLLKMAATLDSSTSTTLETIAKSKDGFRVEIPKSQEWKKFYEPCHVL